jgi:hypothetical protein
MYVNRWYLMIALWMAGNPAQVNLAQAKPVQPVVRAPVTAAQAAESAARRRIVVERTHRGLFATGAVLLRQAPTPDGSSELHMALAGSRAWLDLAEQCYGMREWECAVACSYAGIEELGQEYAARVAIEDSELYLGYAKEQLQKGNNHSAATMMLRILSSRVQMYAKLHADTIAE